MTTPSLSDDNYSMTSNRISEFAATWDSVDDVAQEALAAFCRNGDWVFGAAFFLDGDYELVNRVVWRADDPKLEDFEAVTRTSKFRAERGLPGRVLASGAGAWITDLASDRNFARAPAALRAGLHTAVAFPVQTGAGVVGVLELFRRDRKEEDASLLSLGEQIGKEIGHMVVRKRLEANLTYSEAVRRHLIESAIDAVIKIDSLGLVREWNSTAVRMFGWTQKEVLGHRLSQLIIPLRYRDALRRASNISWSPDTDPWLARASRSKRCGKMARSSP